MVHQPSDRFLHIADDRDARIVRDRVLISEHRCGQLDQRHQTGICGQFLSQRQRIAGHEDRMIRRDPKGRAKHTALRIGCDRTQPVF